MKRLSVKGKVTWPLSGKFCLVLTLFWFAAFSETYAAKRPVPSKAMQRKAEKTIKNVFKMDYKRSRKTNAINDFAQRLLQRAIDTRGDYTTRFVLLREARDFAVKVPNPLLIHDVIDEMAKSYEVDAVEMKSDALKKMRTKVRSVAAGQIYTQSLMRLIDESVIAGRVESAGKLATFLISTAGRLKDPRILVESRVKRDQIKQMKEVWKEAESARARLENDPESASANTAMGLYLCLARNQWAQGLRLISKSNDTDLKSIAYSELTKPADSKSKLALADRWWKLADETDNGFKEIRFLSRARYWYRQAVDGLSGIDRTRAADRIRSIQEFDSQTKRIFLDTLPEFDVIPGPWGVGKNGRKGAANFNNDPIIINEKIAHHGVGLHPPSSGFARIRYRMNQQYGTFVATAGIATKANTRTESPISFVVLGDGKVLWKSSAMRKAQQTQSCALEISEVTVLEIQVICPGSHLNAHAALIDPYVMKAGNLAKK